MALPTSREQLKDYCLRKLGAPLLDINVAVEQIEDRVDEALRRFAEFHFDGSERVYIPHKLTASSIAFAAPSVGTFTHGDTIEGSLSGATARVYDAAGDGLSIRVRFIQGEFDPNDVIVGSNSAATATLAAVDPVTIGDLDRRYLIMPDPILSIQQVIPLDNSATNLFDIRYQFTINNIPSLVSMDLISYHMFQDHVALLNFELTGKKETRFNRKSNRLYIDLDWGRDLQPDMYIIVEAYVALDPEESPEIYGDEWLIEYVTQLIKKQWGDNLSKFSGMLLPGNITFDGPRLVTEAQARLDQLEIELVKKYQLPVDFEVG